MRLATPVPFPGAHGAGGAVVLLHPHPDDEAIFTGVLARRLADAGTRVVLVTATGGEAAGSRVPLRRGESVARRRRAELEQACAHLGVARLVLLGRRDSGLPGDAAGSRRRALARTPVPAVARAVAAVLEEESAAVLVHDGPGGVYGHPDHAASAQAGLLAAGWTGASAYGTTADPALLADAPHHVLHAARASVDAALARPAARRRAPGPSPAPPQGPRAGGRGPLVTLRALPGELAAKRAAMAAHASQMPPPDEDGFAGAYGREWFAHLAGPTLPASWAARPRAVVA